jgi:hypothetical protein
MKVTRPHPDSKQQPLNVHLHPPEYAFGLESDNTPPCARRVFAGRYVPDIRPHGSRQHRGVANATLARSRKPV